MRLQHLLTALRSPGVTSPDDDPDISGIEFDSRRVGPGGLFVAVRGESSDGHRFVGQAVERGAAAVVVEQSAIPDSLPRPVPVVAVPDSREALAWLSAAWHGFPARQLVMIGVTGTDGKTTTSNLIHSILLAAGIRAGLISTVNAVIGGEVLDTGFHVTTPDAPAVQGYLARMVAAGLTHCVLETTSHGWAQRRVDACEFDVGVVTNITHEHLDYHKSYEGYRAAKARLFESLDTAADKGIPKTAVLNRDDSSYAYLGSRTSARVVGYGFAEGEVRAQGARHSPEGTRFTAVGERFAVPVFSPLVGEHNMANLLAALAATVDALGVSPEAAAAGIASLRGVPGRMERIDLGQGFAAMVDFAHTPNALRRVLETARRATAGRVIAVFGSAGLRDRDKRRMMAEVSAEMADLTVLTAEDPRTESLDAILDEMAEGCRDRGGIEEETFWRVPDRGEAIRFGLSMARPGDLVLACGKGHEQSMCFGETEYSWDDRVAMRAALAERLGVPGPEMPELPTSRL